MTEQEQTFLDEDPAYEDWLNQLDNQRDLEIELMFDEAAYIMDGETPDGLWSAQYMEALEWPALGVPDQTWIPKK